MNNIKFEKHSIADMQRLWTDRKLDILVVDDNVELVKYISVLLNRSCNVLKAYDGESGLQLARKANPDLIIIDVSMPTMNGFEMLETIRKEEPISTIPIIMLSGLVDEEAKIEALLGGADDYLIKPFKPRELVVKIHSHIRMVKLRKASYAKEAELRNKIGAIQQDMKSILENTSDAFVGLDKNLNVISFNKSAGKLTGASFSLVEGKNIFECMPYALGTSFEKALKKSLNNATFIDLEYRIPTGKWYELRFYPTFSGISILGVNISGRKNAEKRLISVREELERRVGERTKELKESNERLRMSERHLQQLYRRLDTMRDEERTSLSREVHDQLGQILSAAKIDIKLLEENLNVSSLPLSQEIITAELRSARESLDQALQIVRNIAQSLRGPHVEADGLYNSIHNYASQFEKKTKITCRFHVDENFLPPDVRTASVIYRIFQEAMINVLRHSQATQVTICLCSGPTDFSLKIIDNGVGINEKQLHGTENLGIVGMKERAGSLGGRCDIESIKSGSPGTMVSVFIPLRSDNKHDTLYKYNRAQE